VSCPSLNLTSKKNKRKREILTFATTRTNFSAQTASDGHKGITLPLRCSSGLCTLDTPFKAPGQLTSPVSLLPTTKFHPPEGISTPNCLANSQLTTEYNSPIAITRFMWQATTLKQTMHLGNITFFESDPWAYNRTLVIQVLNRATNFVVSCAFNDPELDGDTARWWPCFHDRRDSDGQEDHGGGSGSLLQREIETWIQLRSQNGELRINQTWYCASASNSTSTTNSNSDDAYQITASSGIAPKLSGWNRYLGIFCGNGSNSLSGMPCPLAPVITGDACDYVFSTRWCTLGDRDGFASLLGGPLKIPLEKVDVVHLPSGEVTEPEPYPGKEEVWSCTVASLGRGPIKWTLQLNEGTDYFAQTAWFGRLDDTPLSDKPEVMTTWFTFSLNNSALAGYPPPITTSTTSSTTTDGILHHVGVREDIFNWIGVMTPGMRTFNPSLTVRHSDFGKGWPPGWKFPNALDWSLRFDIASGYLELNHSWYCNDKSAEKPVVFNGTWQGFLPLDCKWGFLKPSTAGGVVTRYGVTCGFAGGKREFVVTPSVVSHVSETRIPDRNVWA